MRCTWMLSVLLFALAAACNRGGATDTAPNADPGAPGPDASTTVEPRAEPLTVDLPGWQEEVQAEGDHLRRVWRAADATCTVELDRWWGLPPDPGGPMQVASTRTATVDGRDVELLTTSMFNGTEQQVQALFVNVTGGNARLVLRDCPEDATAAVLAAVRLSTPAP